MVLQMISGVAAPTGRINATTAVLLPIGRQMIEQALEQHGAYAVGRGDAGGGRIGNVGSKKFEKI